MSEKRTGSRFAEIRERRMQSPEFRERYQRTSRSIAAVQEIIRQLDAEREHAGLSKSALARRAGTNVAAMRRLLTSGTGNPTLKTLLDVVDALGMELQIRRPDDGPAGTLPSQEKHMPEARAAHRSNSAIRARP
jgi:DNA-binding phage protein